MIFTTPVELARVGVAAGRRILQNDVRRSRTGNVQFAIHRNSADAGDSACGVDVPVGTDQSHCRRGITEIDGVRLAQADIQKDVRTAIDDLEGVVRSIGQGDIDVVTEHGHIARRVPDSDVGAGGRLSERHIVLGVEIDISSRCTVGVDMHAAAGRLQYDGMARNSALRIDFELVRGGLRGNDVHGGGCRDIDILIGSGPGGGNIDSSVRGQDLHSVAAGARTTEDQARILRVRDRDGQIVAFAIGRQVQRCGPGVERDIAHTGEIVHVAVIDSRHARSGLE